MRKLKIGFIVLVVLAVSGIFAHRSLQVSRSGTDSLPGLSAPVEVIYDSEAIPHIYADSVEDAYRALGYIHAKDRLFQMEMTRRLATGRLAEVLGEDLISADRFFRTLRLNTFGAEMAARNDPDSAATISAQAYLEGVNHFVDTGATPLEFRILGIEKEHFTESDVWAIAGYMAYTFAAALKTEPLLTFIRSELGSEYIADIDYDLKPSRQPDSHFQSSLENAGLGADSLREITALIHDIDRIRKPIGIFEGSNAWALSGNRTESGNAILVSDPHISYSQPPVWFEAHVHTPDWEIYGHYLALVPVPLLGHNRHFGWGLTMFQNDDMDLYRETVDPDNHDRMLYNGNYEEVQKESHTIVVKDADDITFDVRISRNGPIINDVISSLEDEAPVSLKWAFHDHENDVLGAFHGMTHAESFSSFRNAVSRIYAPGLNVVYADREGNIAFWAAAKLPRRPDNVHPAFIMDGSGQHAYRGHRPFSENPQIENPPGGAVINANEQTSFDIHGYYNPPYRAWTLQNLIAAQETFSIEDLKEIHSNVSFHYAERPIQVVLEILNDTFDEGTMESQALSILEDWNYQFTADSRGGTIFQEFLFHLASKTFADELGESFIESFLTARFFYPTIATVLENPDSPWWNNVDSDATESREIIVQRAFEKTVASLKQEYGANPAGWRWDRMHTVEYEHPLGSVNLLRSIFNVGPLKIPGSLETIFNTGFTLTSGRKEVSYGPSTRRIIDFGSPEISSGISPTGQSGHAFDHYYDNQAKRYAEQRYRKQYLNREDFADHKIGTFTLNPAPR